MNYVIEARRHPPSDLTAHLYTETRQGATLGGGIPIRRSSVEIISSFMSVNYFLLCYYHFALMGFFHVNLAYSVSIGSSSVCSRREALE